MSDRNYPTEEERHMLLNYYLCHFTAKEVEELTRFSYPTIRGYFRGFEVAGVKKYNRLNLLPEENTDDAECNTRQAAAC